MIKILGVKEKKDGTVDVEIEYTKQAENYLKNLYKKKRFGKKLLKKFILEAVKNYIKNHIVKKKEIKDD